jgi:hypothetical protein
MSVIEKEATTAVSCRDDEARMGRGLSGDGRVEARRGADGARETVKLDFLGRTGIAR